MFKSKIKSTYFFRPPYRAIASSLITAQIQSYVKLKKRKRKRIFARKKSTPSTVRLQAL